MMQSNRPSPGTAPEKESGRSILKRRGRNLSHDSRGTAQSALAWSFAAIFFIVIAVPGALYMAEGIQSTTSDQVFFEPNEPDDMNEQVGGSTSELSDIRYTYTNTSGNPQSVSQTCYYKNETGHDYNELLLEGYSVDEDGPDNTKSQSIYININITTTKLIHKDLSKVKIYLDIARNSSVDFKITQHDGNAGSEDSISTIKGYTKEYNISTNMTKSVLEIDYSKILSASNDMDKDYEKFRIELRNSSGGAFRPADSIKWRVQLIHKDSAVSKFWTMNTVAGITGVFTCIAAVFATPWVDLKDLRGGR